MEDGGMFKNILKVAEHEPIKDVILEIAIEFYGIEDGGMS